MAMAPLPSAITATSRATWWVCWSQAESRTTEAERRSPLERNLTVEAMRNLDLDPFRRRTQPEVMRDGIGGGGKRIVDQQAHVKVGPSVWRARHVSRPLARRSIASRSVSSGKRG